MIALLCCFMRVQKINICIPRAHALSHALKLMRCTKQWNLSSLHFLLPSIPPSYPPTRCRVFYCLVCFLSLLLLSHGADLVSFHYCASLFNYTVSLRGQFDALRLAGDVLFTGTEQIMWRNASQHGLHRSSLSCDAFIKALAALTAALRRSTSSCSSTAWLTKKTSRYKSPFLVKTLRQKAEFNAQMQTVMQSGNPQANFSHWLWTQINLIKINWCQCFWDYISACALFTFMQPMLP